MSFSEACVWVGAPGCSVCGTVLAFAVVAFVVVGGRGEEGFLVQ